MQKALDHSLVDEAKRNPEKAVYVLNFRYVGGCRDSQGLERQLNKLGWTKVADLTSCYAKSTTDGDSDLYQNDVEIFLRRYISRKAGARVSYGISKYIPPNQRPDNYEGIDTLFDEHVQ
jgi:predicted aconitase